MSTFPSLASSTQRGTNQEEVWIAKGLTGFGKNLAGNTALLESMPVVGSSWHTWFFWIRSILCSFHLTSLARNEQYSNGVQKKKQQERSLYLQFSISFLNLSSCKSVRLELPKVVHHVFTLTCYSLQKYYILFLFSSSKARKSTQTNKQKILWL